MREVAILGVGQTPVDEHWALSLRQLATRALRSAMVDAGVADVEAIYTGNMLASAHGQLGLGALIADWSGNRGVEAMKIEAACGSGGAALRAGIMAIGSGQMDRAAVLGIEKMTGVGPRRITSDLATAADSDWELEQGVTFVAINALIMRRYMHEYGWSRGDFAPFSLNAHANAAHNPNARLQETITAEQHAGARMVADPISLLDASPIGDGAAAVILVPAERIWGKNPKGVTISGSAVVTDSLSLHDRKDPTWLQAAHRSARRAFGQSGWSPEDIDVFEPHDAFSILAALSLEACGFAERGQGPRTGLDGEICPGGRIPINTMGGLKARGHPVGATGLYQIVELVQQLRGEAGATQVQPARVGMAQNIGGSGATVSTHLLERRA
jgi:acetyl-CoA C-acetyltransferase